MHAIKLNAHIDRNQRLEIQLPSDTPEGNAEVIVLIPSEAPNEALRRRHLETLFAQIPHNNGAGRSATEIDHQLAEERNSWGK
ncbi:MAG: hypothetical protein ACKVQK_25665 [Burkholderiales bacterium]